VQDLNADPLLPFEDNSFDIVTNAVSIDYITQPLALCREIARVLKPGGVAAFALSNRCFPSKAVNIWLRSDDLQHVCVLPFLQCFFVTLLPGISLALTSTTLAAFSHP
jgi:ubiquinone/menaquinone biosynthesis C-methylase UbiE